MATTSASIGVRELRADLAAIIRRATSGHRVTVSVSGRPAATIGPVAAADGTATVEALVAAGLLVPPRRTDPARLDHPVSVWSGVRLDRVLREVRG